MMEGNVLAWHGRQHPLGFTQAESEFVDGGYHYTHGLYERTYYDTYENDVSKRNEYFRSHRAHDDFGKIVSFVIRKQQPLLAWTANKVIPLLRFLLSTLDGTTLILFCCNRRLHVSSKDDNCGIDLHGCEFSTLR